MALATLDDLADGTRVSVRMGSQMTHWTVDGGGLARDGKRVEPFFLSGLLAEGSVFLREFGPPQPGEWYSERYEGGALLVLSVEGAETTCQRYRRDGQPASPQVVTRMDESSEYTRLAEPPAFAMAALVATAQLLLTRSQELSREKERVRQLHNMEYQVRRAHEYLSGAIRVMERRD